MKLFLAFLFALTLGCNEQFAEDRKPIRPNTSLQIRVANSLIDTQIDPALGRLSRNPKLNTVKINGFDFMNGKSISNYPELFSVSSCVTGDELRRRNNFILGCSHGLRAKTLQPSSTQSKQIYGA